MRNVATYVELCSVLERSSLCRWALLCSMSANVERQLSPREANEVRTDVCSSVKEFLLDVLELIHLCLQHLELLLSWDAVDPATEVLFPIL